MPTGMSRQEPPARRASARAAGALAAAGPVLASLLLVVVTLPGASAASWPAFEDPGWDLDFLHAGEPGPDATYSEIMGSGACLFDHDGDGWEDLLLVNGRYDDAVLQAALDPSSALYRNLAGAGFERVAGALEVRAWGMGCAAGDYDRDGDLDVAFSTWGSPLLYRNDGGASFTNVTASAGLDHTTCGGAVCFGASLAWLDHDSDADLDLYVTNYLAWDGEGPATPVLYEGQCNLLFRNDGDGTFTEVAEDAGVADCGRNHLALAIADADRDGDQDVFIASDETEDTFLRNAGNGTFEDHTGATGLGDPRGGMGAAWGDLDGDGRDDLVITHFEGETFGLYRQQADGTFLERAREDGLRDTKNFVGWGAEFADLDLDGDLDIIIANGHVNVSYGALIGYGQANLVYRNEGDGTFANVTADAWLPAPALGVSRGLALGDLDQDGYLDVVAVNNANESAELWRSTRAANNWLALRLGGNATVNPQALGASVHARAGGADLRREVVASASYLSQSSRDVVLGLGGALRAESLEVRWPDGTRQTFADVGANTLYTLDAGGSLVPLRARALAAAPGLVLADRLGPATLAGELRQGALATATWTVGGETLEGETVERTFATLGDHEAVFRAEASDGSWDEAVTVVRVANLAPDARPAAPATADRASTVVLDGGASGDRDGRVVNWTWSVEGRTYFGPRVEHTFLALGAVEARLTVRDDEGGVGSAAAVVQVANLPPLADAGPDVVGNLLSTFALDASGSADPDGEVVAFHWDLGDGSTAEGERATKQYASPGVYAVRLTATDDDGAAAGDTLLVTINAENAPPVPLPGPDREADRVHDVVFDGARSYDPDGAVTAWRWDFGDGATATGAVARHRYAALGEYEATLTVEDDTGGAASAAVRVRVRNLPPEVDNPGPSQREGLGPVTFEASGRDPDGSIAAWRWDFGDGGAAEGAAVEHAWGAYGYHTVRLTATDDEGASASASWVLRLYARPVALPGPDRATDRLTTEAFDGSASHDPDGRVVAWRWDFGDGAGAAGALAQHRWRALGRFPATLTVIDDDGFEGSAAAWVEVRNLLPAPRGTQRALANVAQPLAFADLGSTDPDGLVVAWRWDFGDGAAAEGPSATHAYGSAGLRLVSLTVTDNDGGSAAAAFTLEVVDWLAVQVATDRAAYGPLDRPSGIATVTFADGSPAADADVALAWVYRALEVEGSPLPALVLKQPQRVIGRTDVFGRLAFEAPEAYPWNPGGLLPFAHAPTAPALAAGAPSGRHHVVASATWAGNGGEGQARYTVGVEVPVPAGLDTPGNVHGDLCPCTAPGAVRGRLAAHGKEASA